MGNERRFHEVDGMTTGQRAMAAARLWEDGRAEAAAQAKLKRAWIASARASFDPGQRRDCAICGRYASVAHAHHLVPLWRQYDSGLIAPDHRFAWLCPTHHSAVHMSMGLSWWPGEHGFAPEEANAILAIAVHGVRS